MTDTALLNLNGKVMAASGGFDIAWFDGGELNGLLEEAHRDGGVKKRLLKKNPDIAIGVLELNHKPAVFLLIAVKTDEQEEVAKGAEMKKFVFNPAILPLRFSWKVDENACFTEVSGELARAVGPHFSDILGKNFAQIAQNWQMDEDGTIRALFKSHHAWSQHKILWPVDGGESHVAVTLFALPVYSRERAFIGFRGYGIIDEAGEVHGAQAGTVVKSGGKSAAFSKGLSAQEKEAFSAIARTLRADLHEEVEEVGEEMMMAEVPADEPALEGTTVPEKEIENRIEQEPPQEEVLLEPEEIEVAEQIDDKTANDGEVSDGQVNGSFDMSEQILQDWLQEQQAEQVKQEGQGGGEPVLDDVAEVAPVDDEDIHDVHDVQEIQEEQTIEDGAAVAQRMAILSPTGLSLEQPVARSFAYPATWDEVGADDGDVKSTHWQTDGNDTLPQQAQPQQQHPSVRADVLPARDDIYDAPFLPLPRAEMRLLQHVPMSVLIYRDNKVLFASDHLLGLTGFPSLDSFRVNGVLRLILRDWLPKNILQGFNGEIYPIRAHMRGVTWFDGAPASMISFTPREEEPQDHLAQELAELQKKAVELSVLLNLVADGVLIIDEGGIIHSLNDAVTQLLGQSAEMMKGKHFSQFFAPLSLPLLLQNFDALRQSKQNAGKRSGLGEAVEVAIHLQNRQAKTLSVQFSHMEMDDGYYVIIREHARPSEDRTVLEQVPEKPSAQTMQKSHYLALVSHEIRTPLNAIVGLSQMMLAEKYGALQNDRYRTYLRDIVSSGEHIMSLINDLLDVAKHAPGKMAVEIAPMSLELALNDVLGMMAPQASKARIIMRSNIAANLPLIAADQRSVKQMIFNLLANAIRFTPAGGQIIVSSMAAAEAVFLRIRDTGSGMSEAELERVMKADIVLEDVALHDNPLDAQGSGIGLPLTRALAKANGAGFHLRSQQGKGTLAEIVFAKAGQVSAHESLKG